MSPLFRVTALVCPPVGYQSNGFTLHLPAIRWRQQGCYTQDVCARKASRHLIHLLHYSPVLIHRCLLYLNAVPGWKKCIFFFSLLLLGKSLLCFSFSSVFFPPAESFETEDVCLTFYIFRGKLKRLREQHRLLDALNTSKRSTKLNK